MPRARPWLPVLLALNITIVALGSTAYIFSAYDPRREVQGLGETMRGAMMLAAVQGVILLAAGLGTWGALHSWQWMVVLAACLMILEVFPTIFGVSPWLCWRAVSSFGRRTVCRADVPPPA